MRSLIPILACLVAAVGCQLGPTVEKFASARNPAGVEMEIQTHDPGPLKQFRGELLAVRDSELVLATREGVLIAPMGAIKRAWSASNPDMYLTRRGGSAGTRELFRSLSRYPQGISPQLLRDLLVAYHQSEPARLK